jgi:hypothetical protein
MSVDYSDHAITMRLRRVSQLRRVCLSLAKATPLESRQTKTPAVTRERSSENSSS